MPTTPHSPGPASAASPTRPAPRAGDAANPVLLRFVRGGEVESIHRGAWALCDAAGRLVEGEGALDVPVFVRSSIKALQALPLFDTGAVERFHLDDEELALALASHDAEPCHTRVVLRTLAKLGLGVEALRCGPQAPGGAAARRALFAAGGKPSALHNNCSGKHAGFLALARQLGAPVERYLEPDSPGQRLVRGAIAELCGLDPATLAPAVDGCSAPTYRMPLPALATAFARLANPDGLPAGRAAHCRRLTAAVARHPVLIAGSRGRLCTALAGLERAPAARGGRLFPKLGAEAVYAVGIPGLDRGLALKVDDGSLRAVDLLVPRLLARLGLLEQEELAALAPFGETALVNRAGLTVGHAEVTVSA